MNVDYDKSLNLYRLRDGQHEVFVAREERIRQKYRKGIRARLSRLSTEYMLPAVPFAHGDVAIDVGANVGEVSLMLAQQFGAKVVAIEPDATEFHALRQNLLAVNGTAINAALWSEAGIPMRFFDRNTKGDSSLISEGQHETGLEVITQTLDSVLFGLIPPEVLIRFLKIDAEGAEPEVLEGSLRTLSRTEYVSVDAGPERSGDTTVVECLAILESAGFKLVNFYHPRAILLFKRREPK